MAAAPAALAKSRPDLRIRSVSKPPAAVERTAGFDVTITVSNAAGTAKASKTAFYLSRSTRKARGAIRLKPDQAVPKLKPRASAVSTTTLVVPGSVRLGKYHLIACADATRKVRERSETNNCKAAPGAIKVTAAKKPPAGKSSSELIDAAVAAHKISAETGLVYKVFALFDDPKLPPEYRASDLGGISDGLMYTVGSSYKTYSASTRARLAPFMVPPMYAGSWWALRHGAGGSASSSLVPRDVIPIICTTKAPPLGDSWGFVDSRNGAVKIWYEKSRKSDAAAAEEVRREIDDEVFTKLQSLMGKKPLPDHGSDWPCRGGDDRLDISIVPELGRDFTSTATLSCDETPAYIELASRTPAADAYRYVVAHETMHAFQYAFPLAGHCLNYKWFYEASAAWAADYVYPTQIDNREHASLPSMLWHPDLPLEYENDQHEYGAHMFPFFLAGQGRAHASLISTIWKYFGQYDDSLVAINAAIPGQFHEQWPKFAFYNWNRAPFDYYNQWDPPLLASDGATVHTSSIDGTVDDSQISVTPDGTGNKLLSPFVAIDHLSARYYDFTIGAGVRTIAFSSLMNDPGKIRALGRLISSWYDLGDWSTSLGADPQYFCRDLTTEQLNELVLIVSNSSYDREEKLIPDSSYPPTVVATNIGCKRWTGTFSGSEHWATGGGQDLTATWSGNATFERDSQFPTVLRLKSASMTWSKSGTVFDIGGSSCTESAGPAQLTAEAGSGEVDLGVTNAKDPRRYDIQILHVDDVPATMTCTGGGGGPFTEHPNPTWLGTVGNGFQVNRVNASGMNIKGDSTATEADGGVINWHWTFNPG
jgi:hypothetical protein